MAALYGLRTRDELSRITLDTTVTPIRSIKMMTVRGNGAFDQYISIPEIKAESFVVVDALINRNEYTSSPQAWYSPGRLHLRQPQTEPWQVMILSQGGEPFEALGTYGIRTRNNDVRTQIDSVNRVLTIRHSGAFQIGFYWRPGMEVIVRDWATVAFPSPIKTYERPLIFLNAVNYMMVGRFYVTGGPGNWTGFRLKQFANSKHHGGAANDYMQIRWFCASYLTPNSPAGEYGASVRDAEGNRTFVTTANLALLNGQPSASGFYRAGTPIEGVGYYASSNRMAWTGSYDDYVLANALFSCTDVIGTTNPIRPNFGGFLPGNRSVLQIYCENNSGANPLSPNGRTLFASRPMKPL